VMGALRSIRVFRLLLATSVSLWLAGAGCLFGCSYGQSAVVEARAASNVVVSGSSCHALRSHDCCAKKHQPKLDRSAAQLHKLLLNALPSGMMSDCPLAVNQIAAVSQVKIDSPGVVSPHSSAPLAVDLAKLNRRSATTPLSIPNKGPTHILHCVFLI
jgi:hypothetical protein